MRLCLRERLRTIIYPAQRTVSGHWLMRLQALWRWTEVEGFSMASWALSDVCTLAARGEWSLLRCIRNNSVDSAAPRVTKQPYLGRHCFPRSVEEGARKGALKIVCSNITRGSNHGCLCYLNCVVEIQKIKRRHLTNLKHVT